MKKSFISPSSPVFSMEKNVEQVDAETKNQRLNQLYKSLMECNQAIVRSKDENELFAHICRNVINFSCMKMACISLVDHITLQLQPVACYGSGSKNGADHAEQLYMSADAHSEYGRGPSGIAFRSNSPFWCQDFQSEPATLPWRSYAEQFGWKACAALPLHKKGLITGILTIYADEVNAFDENTRYLLGELAIDIDHALNRFELEAQRQHSLKMKTLRVFMLELINSDQPLHTTLVDVVHQLETLIPGSICSIMLHDADTKRMRLGAAPNLPALYTSAFDGLPLSEGVGSCINAIASGARTITVDIASDARWVSLRKLASEIGLGACWSEPIFAANEQILGALAVYHRALFQPSQPDIQLVAAAAHFIAIAIERKQAESFLRKLSLAVEQSSNAIIITDMNGVIEYANTTFSTNSGYTPQELIGKKPSLQQSGKTTRAVYADMWAHLGRGESWQGEFINRRKDGSERIDLVRVSPVREADGRITHYLAIEEDITNLKNAQARIKSLAHFDMLTGLPNRLLLDERANRAIRQAEQGQQPLTVMFLDLDHFKNINDSLGHSFGDALLIELAQRLLTLVHKDDTLSRLGGDEFVLLLPGIDKEKAEKMACELMHTINRPYQIDTHNLSIMASIGIAVYPEDGSDFETLSKNADAAMYRAKQEGRNSYRFFMPEMQAHSVRHLQILNALRQAIELNQLEVYYQAQISLSLERIIGAEALLRWRHPELGYISPAEFIPIAEESGLILQVGEWVLRTAIHQAKRWHQAGMPLIIAVNLSAVQFRHMGLPALIMQILTEADFPPNYLELELTESVAMHDPHSAITMMNSLHERGVLMSLDDFGTGYSSLSSLKQFKVYKLKIDQSFVRDIGTDSDDKTIVSAIIGMARNLGLQTIAEGVETIEQLAFLREEGCHEAQGYYYNKPMPAKEFEDFMLQKLPAA